MNYSLSNMLGRGFVATAVAPGPEAAYIAAITSAGATVSVPQQAAISAFISGEIAAGRWDGHKRLYFPVWGVAAANAICMKSLTSGTFVGSLTHEAGFVEGSGGYLDTNSTLSALGITKDSYHVAFLTQGGSDSFDAPWGVTNFNAFYNDGSFSIIVSTNSFAFGNPTLQLLTVGGTNTSRYAKNRTSSTVTTIDSNSVSISTEFSNENFFFMGRNLTGLNAAYDGSVGMMSLGTTLTTAEDTAYTLALKTLWETTTGLTLP